MKNIKNYLTENVNINENYQPDHKGLDNNEAYDLWQTIYESFGGTGDFDDDKTPANEMLSNIFEFIDVDTKVKIAEWFDQDYELNLFEED